jgi:hypothetical protein
MVRVRGAGGLHNAAQKPLGAGAHVHRRGAQPQLINAYHFSSSRSQPAQSAAAEIGQMTFTPRAPRLSSTRIASVGVAAEEREMARASAPATTAQRTALPACLPPLDAP